MKQAIIILACLILTFPGYSQESAADDCFQIKYIDFFGLDQIEAPKWPQSEVEGMLKMDFAKTKTDSIAKTNFIIPLIVYQLKNYHPKCVKEIDTSYLNQLITIYSKIRQLDKNTVLEKSIEEQMDFIRNDFYDQVQDDSLLPNMRLTMDDGPFYGVGLQSFVDLTEIKTEKTDFGSLTIFKKDEKILLTANDKNGKIIWGKVIAGLYDRYLNELHFVEDPIEKTSLATIVHMAAEGERFTLFLKNNGQFMYYYHSW